MVPRVEMPQLKASLLQRDPSRFAERETGAMGYVRGSHLDGTEWRPNLFVTRDPIPGSRGIDVPDFHTDPAGADIVWIDAEPGDVIVHPGLIAEQVELEVADDAEASGAVL